MIDVLWSPSRLTLSSDSIALLIARVGCHELCNWQYTQEARHPNEQNLFFVSAERGQPFVERGATPYPCNCNNRARPRWPPQHPALGLSTHKVRPQGSEAVIPILLILEIIWNRQANFLVIAPWMDVAEELGEIGVKAILLGCVGRPVINREPAGVRGRVDWDD